MVRFKSRWLLVEFLPYYGPGEERPEHPPTITTSELKDCIRESVIKNFGDHGWGSVGDSLSVRYYTPTTGLCIIRVGREHHRILWGAITFITRVRRQRYIPHVVHVSGTIKKVQLAAIKYNRVIVARMRAQSTCGTDYEEYLQQTDKDIGALDKA